MTDRDLAAGFIKLALLLHHHRIRAFGNQRSGKDTRYRARLQRLPDMACWYALGHRQRRMAAGAVGGAYGIAIHLRVIHRGHVQL